MRNHCLEFLSNGFTAISKLKEIKHRSRTVSKVVVDETTINSICNETNKILEKVYTDAMLNASEASFWQQPSGHPFRYLTCEQLKSAIPIMNTSNATGAQSSTYYELDSKLSLQRLAKKLKKPGDANLNPLRIVVIGGSMTTGPQAFEILGHLIGIKTCFKYHRSTNWINFYLTNIKMLQ